MEHCGHVSDSKFEELEDALEEWGDIGEIKEARDCSYGKIYNPIRALYCSDPAVLEKFEACTDHTERLKILVGMEVCIFYNKSQTKPAKLKVESEILGTSVVLQLQLVSSPSYLECTFKKEHLKYTLKFHLNLNGNQAPKLLRFVLFPTKEEETN